MPGRCGHGGCRAAGNSCASQEQSWLERLQAAITDVRRFREQERQRFWPDVWRRWVLAVGFALAAAAAAGAGYGSETRPHAAELAELRSRVQLADAIARRTMTMSPAERRQFDNLSHTPMSLFATLFCTI